VQAALWRWFGPSRWRLGIQDRLAVADADSDAGFLSDEGEELGDVDDDRRRALSLDDRNGHTDSERRLSRE
jgi:hypothetical protein